MEDFALYCYYYQCYRFNNSHLKCDKISIFMSIISISHLNHNILEYIHIKILLYLKSHHNQCTLTTHYMLNKEICIFSKLHLNHNIQNHINIIRLIYWSLQNNYYINLILNMFYTQDYIFHKSPTYHKIHQYKHMQILPYQNPRSKINKIYHPHKFCTHFCTINKQNFNLQKIHHCIHTFPHAYFLLMDINHIFQGQNKLDIKAYIMNIMILRLYSSLKYTHKKGLLLINFYKMCINQYECMFYRVKDKPSINRCQLLDINQIYKHIFHFLKFFQTLQHIINKDFNFSKQRSPQDILYNFHHIHYSL